MHVSRRQNSMRLLLPRLVSCQVLHKLSHLLRVLHGHLKCCSDSQIRARRLRKIQHVTDSGLEWKSHPCTWRPTGIKSLSKHRCFLVDLVRPRKSQEQAERPWHCIGKSGADQVAGVSLQKTMRSIHRRMTGPRTLLMLAGVGQVLQDAASLDC